MHGARGRGTMCIKQVSCRRRWYPGVKCVIRVTIGLMCGFTGKGAAFLVRPTRHPTLIGHTDLIRTTFGEPP